MKTKRMMKRKNSLKIYVLDDDHIYRKLLVCYVESLGYQATGFQTSEECLVSLNRCPDVVLLDHNLEGEENGVDILRFIKREYPDISVIYITGEESTTLVSEVFRSGSEDFIGKDSASLLRLKVKLDQLAKRKAERWFEKKRNQKLILAGAVILGIFLIMQYVLIR